MHIHGPPLCTYSLSVMFFVPIRCFPRVGTMAAISSGSTPPPISLNRFWFLTSESGPKMRWVGEL